MRHRGYRGDRGLSVEQPRLLRLLPTDSIHRLIYPSAETPSTGINHGIDHGNMATSLGIQVQIAPPHIPASSPPLSIPISVTVQNLNKTTPLTLLKWGTPFDPQANVLGIFHIHDKTDDVVVPLDTIKVSRLLPPRPDDLVEIAAGASVENVVTLPRVPLTTGHEYTLQTSGFCQAAWRLPLEDVKMDRLEKFQDTERVEYSSNVVSLQVD